MKKVLLFIFSFLFCCNMGYSQLNAEIIGKTVTDTIVIKDGAAPGFILQSVDATGLGEWVNPVIFGGADNLGNHSATINLSMNNFGIDKPSYIQFSTGATYSDDGLGGLEFTGPKIIYNGTQLQKLGSVGFLSGATYTDDGAMGLEFTGNRINYSGAQLQNARLLSFALSGGDTQIAEVPGSGIAGAPPTEVQITSGGGPIPVGIGGPVNPPPSNPITSVLINGNFPTLPPTAFMFGVYGDAWATDWFAISDARFKKNIEPIYSALDKVNRLEAVTYQLDKEKFAFGKIDEAQTIGFLAQDIAKVVPEAVKVNANGVHLVRYNALIPVLAQAINELDEKVQENQALEAQVQELQKLNKDILNRLEKLEKN